MNVAPTPVWVVDDDPDDQLLMQEAFKNINPSMLVLVLPDGESLLERLVTADVLPRLILLDLNMPRLTGFDVLQQLRKDPQWDLLPIYLLSTSASLNDKQFALRLGAKGFLTKPGSYSELVALLRHLVLELGLAPRQ